MNLTEENEIIECEKNIDTNDKNSIIKNNSSEEKINNLEEKQKRNINELAYNLQVKDDNNNKIICFLLYNKYIIIFLFSFIIHINII